MNLPTRIVPYVTALLSAPKRYSFVFLASIGHVSHDSLNRSLLYRYDWKGWLRVILSSVNPNEGYLIIDETDIDHSYARLLSNALWIFSHRYNRYIFGYHLVVLAWTNGKITIPLGWKIYDATTSHKKITKLTLAKELLIYALHTLHLHPKAVLFDTFYASADILLWLDREGIPFVSQVKKNRKIDGKRVDSFPGAHWTRQGYLEKHIQVQVVRNRKKYFVTNDLSMTRNKQLACYSLRWRIEEIFRFTKQECGLESCQATTERIQHNHFGTCFLIYAILQVTYQQTDGSLYAMKLKACSQPHYAASLISSTLFAYA